MLHILFGEYNVFFIVIDQIFQCHGKVFQNQISFAILYKVIVVLNNILMWNLPKKFIFNWVDIDFLDNNKSVG